MTRDVAASGKGNGLVGEGSQANAIGVAPIDGHALAIGRQVKPDGNRTHLAGIHVQEELIDDRFSRVPYPCRVLAILRGSIRLTDQLPFRIQRVDKNGVVLRGTPTRRPVQDQLSLMIPHGRDVVAKQISELPSLERNVATGSERVQ